MNYNIDDFAGGEEVASMEIQEIKKNYWKIITNGKKLHIKQPALLPTSMITEIAYVHGKEPGKVVFIKLRDTEYPKHHYYHRVTKYIAEGRDVELFIKSTIKQAHNISKCFDIEFTSSHVYNYIRKELLILYYYTLATPHEWEGGEEFAKYYMNELDELFNFTYSHPWIDKEINRLSNEG